MGQTAMIPVRTPPAAAKTPTDAPVVVRRAWWLASWEQALITLQQRRVAANKVATPKLAGAAQQRISGGAPVGATQVQAHAVGQQALDAKTAAYAPSGAVAGSRGLDASVSRPLMASVPLPFAGGTGKPVASVAGRVAASAQPGSGARTTTPVADTLELTIPTGTLADIRPTVGSRVEAQVAAGWNGFPGPTWWSKVLSSVKLPEKFVDRIQVPPHPMLLKAPVAVAKVETIIR